VILDAASEGLHVITAMLIVGLVFLAVILLGELSNWAGHRRAARRRARRQAY
jgi:predicted membrane protein